MEKEHIAKLREIALAVGTPGEWELDTNVPFSDDLTGIFCVLEKRYPVLFDYENQPKKKDAEFIATFDPATVLEMLTRLHDLEHLAGVIETIKKTGGAVEVHGVRITPLEDPHGD